MGSTSGRRVIEALTNKTGGAIIKGDVVAVDEANDSAFKTTTTAGYTGTVGVAEESIANNAVGRICTAGQVELVNVNASVTRGNFGKTHTVAKQATDAGAARASGAFCQFLTGGTTPKAHLFGIVDASTSSSGVPAGTSFPGSPANNDLFYRTDRDLLYFYDGTRWLTVQLFTLSIPPFDRLGPFTTTGNSGRAPAAFGSTYDAWLVDLRAWLFVSGTNTGSAYWTLTIKDEVPNTLATADTSADAGSTDLYKIVAIGALLGTARKQIVSEVTKTSTPGSLYLAQMLTYRLVG